MDVDHSQARNREDVSGEDAAVGRDDPQVRVQGRELRGKLRRFQARRLEDWRRKSQGRGLDLRGLDAVASTSGPVGLRDHAHDDVAGGGERLE